MMMILASVKRQGITPDCVSGSVLVRTRRAKAAQPRASIRMDNSIVCPGFSIGLALDDKNFASDQIGFFFQNCFRAVTLDAELGAIGDQARLQACGQGISVGGPDFLPLRID